MKIVKIGLFGAWYNNDNMGCCALTYSLLALLKKIESGNNFEFHYIIFERVPDENLLIELSRKLDIKCGHLSTVRSVRFIRIYNIRENVKCKEWIKKCDFIIDLTQGDSFTDIYGFRRFISYSMDKIIIERCGIPLVLGPQTYGPYHTKFAQRAAVNIIENAFSVFSRDESSAEYLRAIGVKRKIQTATDLAFGLPFHKGETKHVKKAAGISPSGLLWPDRTEAAITKFQLKCDYERFTYEMVEILEREGYEVHLVPHVGVDGNICDRIHTKYPNTVYPGIFHNPVEVKSYIADMDVFIGARMHATIAAISSGVAVLPLSYSRKFQGLFDTLDYPYLIDMVKMTTEECITYFSKWICSIDKTESAVHKSLNIAEQKHQELIERFREEVYKLLNYNKGDKNE